MAIKPEAALAYGLMITRPRVVVAIFVASLFGVAGQPVNASAQDSSNLICVEKMELPSYPPIAQQARLSGTITVKILLSATGSAQDVNVQADPKASGTAKDLLGPVVANVIRRAAFDPNCGGKTVSIVFVFELAGTSMGPAKQTAGFGSPNKFWIRSEAPHYQP